MDAILLSPHDNVAVLVRAVPAGAGVHVDRLVLTTVQPVGLGHKLAIRPIRQGEKILKYGAPIGSAIRDIEPGEHVHLHNMKSDYLPTYTLDQGRTFRSGR